MLKELVYKNLTAKEIGKILSRTETAIFNRIKKNNFKIAKAEIPKDIQDNPIKTRKYVWKRRIKDKLTRTSDGCFIWGGAKDGKGYGQVNILNKIYLIHRIALEIKLNRTLERDECACHKCDISDCCNPDHIFLSDQLGNVRDMWEKGRQGGQFKKGHIWPEEIRAKGVDISISKLTPKQVIEIRSIYNNTDQGYKKIAKKYPVTPGTIRAIIKRRTWKHI